MTGPNPHLHYFRRSADELQNGPDGPLLMIGPQGVLVAQDDSRELDPPRIPRLSDVNLTELSPPVVHQIAIHDGQPVYVVSLPESRGVPDKMLLQRGYRDLYGKLSDVELGLVGRAIQIVDWEASSRFCPRCGVPTTPAETEAMTSCPECGLTQYPRLAPAMIVGVVREGKLLLAQSPRFKGVFHSILAGFVEPGESVEECVHREVFEEVGVSVENIRYFGSQCWPFPHSLMLGFLADWAGGEINPDPSEIVHADWYGPDELPQVPSEISISGRIINWFRNHYSGDSA